MKVGHHCYMLVLDLILITACCQIVAHLALSLRGLWYQKILLWARGRKVVTHKAFSKTELFCLDADCRIWTGTVKEFACSCVTGQELGQTKDKEYVTWLYHPVIVKPLVTPCSCTFQAFKG